MSEPIRFAIFIYDEVEPIDLGGTFGVLSMAKRISPSIEMFLVAENAGSICLTNGLVVEAHFGVDNRPDADVLIVTGGAGWTNQTENPKVLEFIRNCAKCMTVASVCTGGLILAASGILDGLTATTKREVVKGEHSPIRLMEESYPKVNTIPARLVDTGTVVTGGGVSLAIDVTLHLIDKMCGKAISDETARIIEYSAASQANEKRLQAVIC